jgi:hypothetical protein
MKKVRVLRPLNLELPNTLCSHLPCLF